MCYRCNIHLVICYFSNIEEHIIVDWWELCYQKSLKNSTSILYYLLFIYQHRNCFFIVQRYTDTNKVFNLRPENLYNNIDVKRSGEPLTRQDVCGLDDMNCDPLLRPENVKGKIIRS